jgi:hypothetical protein
MPFDFKAKIGPLPAIGWAGVVGGTIVLYKMYKNRTTTSVPAGTQDPNQMYATSGTGADAGYGNATSSYNGSTSTATDVIGEPAIPDDTTWGRRALNWLISQGVNPADASTALNAYLNGNSSVNSTQLAALNEALTHFGAPPSGVRPIPSASSTASVGGSNTPPPLPPPNTNPNWYGYGSQLPNGRYVSQDGDWGSQADSTSPTGYSSSAPPGP